MIKDPYIDVRFSGVDGARKRRTFKSLKGAQRWAHLRVGAHPDFGSTYAVSADGIGKIEVAGATLAELFPAAPEAPARSPCHCESSQVYGGDCVHTLAGEEEYHAQLQAEENAAMAEAARSLTPPAPYRAPGCTCCDWQLAQVGCDCGNVPF